jgi:hypothetical protein
MTASASDFANLCKADRLALGLAAFLIIGNGKGWKPSSQLFCDKIFKDFDQNVTDSISQ